MSITIICTGNPVSSPAGKYSSEGFDRAVSAAQASGILPYSGRKFDPAGRSVLLGEGRLAAETAAQLILPGEFRVEALLNEIPVRSFTDTEKLYPVETWYRKAASQRRCREFPHGKRKALSDGVFGIFMGIISSPSVPSSPSDTGMESSNRRITWRI